MRREVGALGSALLGLVLACSARQAPGTRTEAQVIAPAAPCEVESAVARVREEMNRGQLYRAWRRLEESPSCALDDVRVQHLKLELLWELRDLPALTELAGRLLAANPKNAAAREAQRRVTSYRAAARLGAAERAEYERLLESLAKANAEQDPKARELFERARGLGESGELLFEGGLLAQQAGRRAEARRLWDAATTLLEAEFGAAPEALEHQAKRRPTLWAGESHLWFGSLLYDFARRRFVAYVPRSPDPLAKRRDVFAAADDWVFFDGELWSVASGRRVGVIPAEAAVSAPSGEHLYVLSGPDVLRYSTHDGTLLEREGRLERSASSARAPASMLVTPSEAFLGVMALSKRVVFDLQRGRELLEVDAFDFVVLDGAGGELGCGGTPPPDEKEGRLPVSAATVRRWGLRGEPQWPALHDLGTGSGGDGHLRGAARDGQHARAAVAGGPGAGNSATFFSGRVSHRGGMRGRRRSRNVLHRSVDWPANRLCHAAGESRALPLWDPSVPEGALRAAARGGCDTVNAVGRRRRRSAPRDGA
jgi:tetratricopeptide (TPR) repeat protein